MEEKLFMLLPHAALIEWVCVVEREPHSLLGLEWFYLSKLRKNKTLAEAWTAVGLEKDYREAETDVISEEKVEFSTHGFDFFLQKQNQICVMMELLSAVVVNKNCTIY